MGAQLSFIPLGRHLRIRGALYSLLVFVAGVAVYATTITYSDWAYSPVSLATTFDLDGSESEPTYTVTLKKRWSLLPGEQFLVQDIDSGTYSYLLRAHQFDRSQNLSRSPDRVQKTYTLLISDC